MEQQWWKEAVAYEIYPRSFNDSDGDGIGDLQGIIEKVDYLDKLGIDVVWLGPVYQSPNADNGYDISDYKAIMDEFGTLDDWEELLDELHNRDMKLIMDLVVNHTSDEHQWFVESRSAKDNDYRDYYIWRSGEEGTPPNNWESNFGGSAWQYDEETGEYYLHLFHQKQPDLNWENPDLRTEIYEMMKWWLDKGIDGFRMDVINFISKEPELPDDKDNEGELPTGANHYVDGPKVHDYLQEMNQEVLSNYDILTVGEMPFVDVDEGVKYVSSDRDELNMLFHFEHMLVDTPEGGRWSGTGEWKLTDLKEIITKWQVEMQEQNGWNSLYLNNHDQPRAVSRFANDEEYRVESAKMLATLLLTLRGTPYLYQGEEIGMTNFPFESLEQVQDVDTLNKFKEEKKKGNIDNFADAKEIIRTWSRDNSRTPMQWDNSEQAGFSDGEPWIDVNPNYEEINVAANLANPNSIFHYYQDLIDLRKSEDVLVYGDYRLLLEDSQSIYSYLRVLEGERVLVMLNFSADETKFELPQDIDFSEQELLINNYEVRADSEIKEIDLKPYEARVYKLS
ncbi:glycoside hydrolase family 13 protein [Halanaerobacter jeridensis]|uniref:Oligo-1,6-glucosidase n=1 Tax=Halanaerobacter jeridensis TaxID=706427 RepID=A0A939BRB8_9FIRM|nr:alpha-glucosidase [Halanaerobacter jeridensis]MBM7555831.1 oligo-1,6-glucosidase [Halanaerobacter jeridensis]